MFFESNLMIVEAVTSGRRMNATSDKPVGSGCVPSGPRR
jgi:hypothetical protein